MIKPWDRAERFALCAFATARRAKKNKRLLFHLRNPLILQAGPAGEAESDQLFPGCERIDIHPAPAAIEPHVAVQQRKNCVVAPKADILSGQKFCPALAHNDVAGHDHFAAEFFHTKPLADAIASVFNDALSFIMSHWREFLVES
jgi:hypothetical protein